MGEEIRLNLDTVEAIVRGRTILAEVRPSSGYLHAGKVGPVTDVNRQNETVKIAFNKDEDGWYPRREVQFLLPADWTSSTEAAPAETVTPEVSKKVFYIGDKVTAEGVVKTVDGAGVVVEFNHGIGWHRFKGGKGLTLTESTFADEPADGTIVRTKPQGSIFPSGVQFWIRDDVRFEVGSIFNEQRVRHPRRWYRVGGVSGDTFRTSWPEVHALGVTVMVDG